MDRLFKSGRYVFAASIFAFGAENLILAHLKQDVVPVMPWVPGFQPLAYLTGLALAAAGICIAANLRPRLVSILLGLFFLVCAVAIQAPSSSADSTNAVGFAQNSRINLKCSVCSKLTGSNPYFDSSSNRAPG